MDRPDLLYVLSHGFAARMVLHSDLIPELRRRGLRVGVLSGNADKPYFRDLCERRGALPFRAPEVATRLLGHYSQARRYLFEDFEKNAALRSKHEWDMHHRTAHPLVTARSIAGKALNSLVLRAPALPRSLAKAEARLLRSEPLRRVLSQIAPRMLVATYPVAWLEALSILEARRMSIPTVGQLLSWDNITCKGRFAAVPDHFVSWGSIMSEELRLYYGVEAEDVIEAGVAHFDLHTRPVEPTFAAGELRKLGLDPGRPYLFFGMSASYFAPREIDIVTWLANRIAEGRFGGGLQLLVRPHPQTIRGPMADAALVAKLRQLPPGPVAVDIPEVVSEAVDIAEHDMRRLAALLHGAAVTLNSGSTLIIDALLHDRPVVVTLFDADDDLPWCESARRLGEFPHLEKLLSYGGARVARSFEDLRRLVQGYLDDPSLDAHERARAREAECGPADGQACSRIADGLLDLTRRYP